MNQPEQAINSLVCWQKKDHFQKRSYVRLHSRRLLVSLLVANRDKKWIEAGRFPEINNGLRSVGFPLQSCQDQREVSTPQV